MCSQERIPTLGNHRRGTLLYSRWITSAQLDAAALLIVATMAEYRKAPSARAAAIASSVPSPPSAIGAVVSSSAGRTSAQPEPRLRPLRSRRPFP
jgi:hypothetical protein